MTLAWTTYTCGSRVVFWRAGKHLWAQVKADVTDLFTWQRCECASELPGTASQIQHDADAAEPIGDEGRVYSQGVGADLSCGVTTQLPSETYDNPCELCLCFSRTTQDVTRIKQDIWLNPEGGVMQLSLREPTGRLMLIDGQCHAIRGGFGEVDKPDMLMRGGNRMDIQIDGWV